MSENITNYDLDRTMPLDELMQTWMARAAGTPERHNPTAGNILDVIFISARERTNIESLRDLLYRRVRELHVQKYPFNDFLFDDYRNPEEEGES